MTWAKVNPEGNNSILSRSSIWQILQSSATKGNYVGKEGAHRTPSGPVQVNGKPVFFFSSHWLQATEERPHPFPARAAASVQVLMCIRYSHTSIFIKGSPALHCYQIKLKKALTETFKRYEKESQTSVFQTSPSGCHVSKKGLRVRYYCEVLSKKYALLVLIIILYWQLTFPMIIELIKKQKIRKLNILLWLWSQLKPSPTFA